MRKISIIGGGNIGGSICFELAKCSNLNLVLLDRKKDFVKGKILDISHAMTILEIDTNLLGTSNFEDIEDSEVIVVTAGATRKAGMTREDLVNTNAKIISDIAVQIKKFAPNSFVIVVTNPLDAMTYLMQKITNFMPEKVVGMAGILDTARFKFLLKKHFGYGISNISSIVLGGHGDQMVPMIDYTHIAGMQLNLLLSKLDFKNKFVEPTKNGGAEIIELMGTSAFYAPSMAVIQMINSYIFNQRKILPCSVKMRGEYELNDIYFGAPVVIGKNGVESIIELPISEEIKKLIHHSSDIVSKTIEKIQTDYLSSYDF